MALDRTLPRSDYEIVLLPPDVDDGLISTTQIADKIWYAPNTLGRLTNHLKSAGHGEWRPAVAYNSGIPIQHWWWNEEGRHAVLKQVYWPTVWPQYWSRGCPN